MQANTIGAFHGAELILFRSPPSVIPSAQMIAKGNKKKTCQSYGTCVGMAKEDVKVCICVYFQKRASLSKERFRRLKCLQMFCLQGKKFKQVEIRDCDTIIQNSIQHLLDTCNAYMKTDNILWSLASKSLQSSGNMFTNNKRQKDSEYC